MDDPKLQPHEVLGVAPDASVEEIKRAYRDLANMVHPDRNKSPTAGDEFRAVKEAFEAMVSAKHGGKLPPWAKIWLQSSREILAALSTGVEKAAAGDVAGMFGEFQAAASGAQERIADAVAFKDKCVETFEGMKAVGSALTEFLWGNKEK